MRYFIELAYNGAAYHGWQVQPKQVSVQETITHALSLILRSPGLEIMGCGRTDTGVHASEYFAHFDFDGEFPKGFLSRLNKFLPKDIAIRRIFPVADDQHARFDAHYRAYQYHLTWQKDPFRQDTIFHLHRAKHCDQALMQEAAALLLKYDEFLPFCKTGSDAKTMRCELFRSEWEFNEGEWVYHIAANRFLRGMVRLIVGMSISVGEGKLTIAQVRQALDKQEHLPKSLSIAPEGLFLTEVRYAFLEA
ncbi:MAG: tRNA pseudouridine(38-40) synthase TruA [Lewinella sp.]|jgi:tRNA pseudouridine38-40 synthase|uniref:tRNA pseudouridine(38-40) synthase TruA n=1 Tax=Lewinella sp. TaxID=2004506 RepID=UPI003D6BEE19